MKKLIKAILRKYYFIKAANAAFERSFWTLRTVQPLEEDLAFDRMADIGYAWFVETVKWFRSLIPFYTGVSLAIAGFAWVA